MENKAIKADSWKEQYDKSQYISKDKVILGTKFGGENENNKTNGKWEAIIACFLE